MICHEAFLLPQYIQASHDLSCNAYRYLLAYQQRLSGLHTRLTRMQAALPR